MITESREVTRLAKRLRCWWFGCAAHIQDSSPLDELQCMRCGGVLDYYDLVGDTRHSRFMDFCRQWGWRRLWPKRCTDCGHRFKCDDSVDHIPF